MLKVEILSKLQESKTSIEATTIINDLVNGRPILNRDINETSFFEVVNFFENFQYYAHLHLFIQYVSVLYNALTAKCQDLAVKYTALLGIMNSTIPKYQSLSTEYEKFIHYSQCMFTQKSTPHMQFLMVKYQLEFAIQYGLLDIPAVNAHFGVLINAMIVGVQSAGGLRDDVRKLYTHFIIQPCVCNGVSFDYLYVIPETKLCVDFYNCLHSRGVKDDMLDVFILSTLLQYPLVDEKVGFDFLVGMTPPQTPYSKVLYVCACLRYKVFLTLFVNLEKYVMENFSETTIVGFKLSSIIQSLCLTYPAREHHDYRLIYDPDKLELHIRQNMHTRRSVQQRLDCKIQSSPKEETPPENTPTSNESVVPYFDSSSSESAPITDLPNEEEPVYQPASPPLSVVKKIEKPPRRRGNMRFLKFSDEFVDALLENIQTKDDFDPEQLLCLLNVVKYHSDSAKRLTAYWKLKKVAETNDGVAMSCRAIEKQPDFYVLLAD